MVTFGPTNARIIRRLMVAAVSGLAASWLGVAALITLSIAWPHNPVPRVLLSAWAVLVAVSFAIPGVSPGPFRGRGLVVFLAVPATRARRGRRLASSARGDPGFP